MGLKQKILDKKIKMQEQMQRGIERTNQMKAEKLRKKSKRLSDMNEGTKKTIAIGLATKQNPFEVMKTEYNRRKQKRENK